MKSLSLTVSALFLVCSSPVFAILTWTGGGDGRSLYQEANFSLNGGGPPPAGTVDANVEVNDDIFVESGTPGGPGGFGPHLRMGTGSLTIVGSSVFRGGAGSAAGIRADDSDTGSNYVSMFVGDSAQVLAQFLSKVELTIDGAASLTLYGGGNPVNNSSIDILTADVQVIFLTEDVDAVMTEHLGKIFVNGEPAVVGMNLDIVSDGGTGSIVSATIIPEPAVTAAFFALAAMALVFVRRRSAIS